MLLNATVQPCAAVMARTYFGQFSKTVPAIELVDDGSIFGVTTTDIFSISGLAIGPVLLVVTSPLGRQVHMICVLMVIELSPKLQQKIVRSAGGMGRGVQA